MSALLLNLILAIAWAALQGSIDSAHLIFGFVLGYVVLWLVRPLIGNQYHAKLPRACAFVLYFLRQLALSTARVAWEVLTPTVYRRPAIVAVPLDVQSDLEVTLLANLITLTPGSLSLEVADDRSVLYVHGMFVDDPDTFAQEIKDGFERRVLELLR